MKNPLGAFRRRHGTALARLFDDAELRLVDIGARGAPPPPLARLAQHSHLYAFEPEAEEVGRLESGAPSEWASVTLVPEAIASVGDRATLHVTSHPGMSSLLPPDPEVFERYWKAASFEVVSTQEVPTTPLDAAADRYGFADACYLKLDTQGTELDILRSGEDLLRRSVVGIYVESLFQPFYAGQSLFADVDVHLRERGFDLVDMRPWFMRGNGHDAGAYSRRQPVWAHCVYLRDLGRAPVEAPLERAWARWLAIAVAYEQFDLVLASLRAGPARDVLEPVYGEALAEEVAAEAEALTAIRLDGLSAQERSALLRASGPT